MAFLFITACQTPDDKPDRFNPRPQDRVQLCEPSKEYITTTQFLRDQKDSMRLRDIDIHRVADEVSRGCSGAAARFVRAYNILDKLQVGANATVAVSAKLAQKKDTFADVYLGVLTRAYLAEFLDMDLMTSMKLAESLSVDYEGEVKIALDDFTKLVDFCLKRIDVELSLANCGSLAGRLAKASEKFNAGLADGFIKTFEYLTKSDGIQMKVSEAIEFAEQIALAHPKAVESFMMAHAFALNKNGLDLDARRSLLFAKRLAGRTRWEWKDDGQTEPLEFGVRFPASQNTPEAEPYKN